LKHIETIKSIVLLSLVILSFSLTFSIWSYKAKYETIEQTTTVEVAIADKREISELIKPYKLIFNLEEGLKGTTDANEINELMSTLGSWKVSNIEAVDTEFTEDKLDSFLRENSRLTFYFQGEVPISVYRKVLNVEELNVPDFSFDRILVEWNPAKSVVHMHFINRTKEFRYSARVLDVNPQILLSGSLDYEDYVEANPKGTTRFIAVPENPVELVRSTSYEMITSPSKFRDALFYDPNAVTRSQVGVNNEDYQDDHALMSIDKISKKLNYVQPIAESKDVAIPSELLLNTIEFMNEHGGWTDEYRFTYMDPSLRYVKFQLNVRGLPVFSNTMPTEIEQYWGDDRIFRYVRPYYSLDFTFQSEGETELLLSGAKVAEILMASAEIDFDKVEEIIPGYLMKHDVNPGILILEPSWYYKIQNRWVRFSPEQFGGEKIGLE